MKNKDLYESLRRRVKKEQSRQRYEHSVSVGEWAAQLGEAHGWDAERARLAGLLHDYVKEWSPKELKRYAKKRKLDIPDKKFIIETAPNMLHAYVSADVVRRKKWITNKRDLLAISSHTLGRERMGIEEKILFIADFSEPRRPYKASAEEIRRIALKDLDAGFREALAHKIGWQLKKCKAIHPTPFRVWNRVVCRVKR
jgi:nicotinate-nucleotide adenylyltransferase